MKAMAEIDAEADGQLAIKKRARRRLVGAIALALLAVIVLPMVMDQEPKPLTQDIAIRIPSQDAGAFPAIPEAKPAKGVAAAPPVAQAVPSPQVAQLPNVVATPPHVAQPVAEPKSEGKPETKPELPKAVQSPKVTEPPKQVVSPPKQVVKPAEAKPEAAHEALHEQWVLQLGAYQDQANVKQLQAKLKSLGYASYTENVDTPQGSRTRVRGGPFATREAAEKAQARMKKLGAGGPPGGIVAQKQ